MISPLLIRPLSFSFFSLLPLSPLLSYLFSAHISVLLTQFFAILSSSGLYFISSFIATSSSNELTLAGRDVPDCEGFGALEKGEGDDGEEEPFKKKNEKKK